MDIDNIAKLLHLAMLFLALLHYSSNAADSEKIGSTRKGRPTHLK